MFPFNIPVGLSYISQDVLSLKSKDRVSRFEITLISATTKPGKSAVIQTQSNVYHVYRAIEQASIV